MYLPVKHVGADMMKQNHVVVVVVQWSMSLPSTVLIRVIALLKLAILL